MRQVYRQLRSQELDGLRKAVLSREGTGRLSALSLLRGANPGLGLHRDASQLTDGGSLSGAERRSRGEGVCVCLCVRVSPCRGLTSKDRHEGAKLRHGSGKFSLRSKFWAMRSLQSRHQQPNELAAFPMPARARRHRALNMTTQSNNEGPEEQYSVVTAEHKTVTPAGHSLQLLLVRLVVKLSERTRPQGTK